MSDAPDAGGGAGLISISAAAKLLMITDQWVRQLCNKGFIEKKARGQVSLVGAVQGYIKFLKDEERRTSKTAADSRVKDLRSDELSLRIEDRSGALVKEAQAEAVAVVDEIAGALRSDMLALPARVTNDLALRRKFEDGIDDAFRAASKRATDAAGVGLKAGAAMGRKKKDRAGSVGAGKPGVSGKRGRSRTA